MIAEGDGIDINQLAALAGVSLKGATRCREAYKGVTEALREAGMLKGKAVTKKPSTPEPVVEPASEAEAAAA